MSAAAGPRVGIAVEDVRARVVGPEFWTSSICVQLMQWGRCYVLEALLPDRPGWPGRARQSRSGTLHRCRVCGSRRARLVVVLLDAAQRERSGGPWHTAGRGPEAGTPRTK